MLLPRGGSTALAGAGGKCIGYGEECAPSPEEEIVMSFLRSSVAMTLSELIGPSLVFPRDAAWTNCGVLDIQ